MSNNPPPGPTFVAGRPLVLASRSPRRAWLLARAGLRVEIVAPAEETEQAAGGRKELSAQQQALAAARAKAFAIADVRPEAVVLGADTVVALGDEVLGKPRTAEEARGMLARLAGRAHGVYTAVVLAAKVRGRVWELAAEVVGSRVLFRPLSPQQIADYVATGEPLDKAGAYGIQGRGGEFVERVEGPWDNVVGLPTEAVRRLLTGAAETLARLEEDEGETPLDQ